jgi:hypothetical protein
MEFPIREGCSNPQYQDSSLPGKLPQQVVLNREEELLCSTRNGSRNISALKRNNESTLTCELIENSSLFHGKMEKESM